MTTDLRPFRFGVQTSTASSRAEWVALAQRVESHGYDVLTMPDHFTDQLAPVPALMCAADATQRLRIGALVWDNDYKHPVVFAKEMATMDLLSNGRLELGLGAGWMVSDYEQSGIAYDRPGVRIDRFAEALEVITRSFAPGPFDFSGEHYQITGYEGLPKPLQTPVPILIGGGGKRVLGLAARYAHIVGINGTMTAGVVGPDAISTMTASAVDDKVAITRAAAETAGRLDQIEWNIRAFMVNVTANRSAVVDAISGALAVDRSMVDESPFALIGTPAQIVEMLRERRERWGFSYIVVGAEDTESFAPVVAELAGT